MTTLYSFEVVAMNSLEMVSDWHDKDECAMTCHALGGLSAVSGAEFKVHEPEPPFIGGVPLAKTDYREYKYGPHVEWAFYCHSEREWIRSLPRIENVYLGRDTVCEVHFCCCCGALLGGYLGGLLIECPPWILERLDDRKYPDVRNM